MLINAVCGNGLGSSLILKINIDKVLKELGKSADVETLDIASVTSSNADLFITTSQFKKNFEDVNKEIIYVNNVTDKDMIKEELIKYFNGKGE